MQHRTVHPDDLKDWYSEAKDSSLGKKTGISLPEKQRLIGIGTQGGAFSIGGGKVLKLTKDASEAKAAALIVGKKLRGIYRVHGSYELRGALYAIVMDSLEPLDTKEYDVVQWLSGSQIGWLKELNVPRFHKIAGARGTESLIKALESDEAKAILKQDQKTALDISYGMLNLYKLGIDFDDLHGENVMKRGNDYFIIDLGYSTGARGTPTKA